MSTPDAAPASKALPVPADLAGLADKATSVLHTTRADSTQTVYGRDWADLAAWCRTASFAPLPATLETVGLYLTLLADRLAVAVLGRRPAATVHQQAGQRLDTGHPAIRDLLHRIHHRQGITQRRVAPAATPVVQAISVPVTTPFCCSATRRREIVAPTAADLQIIAEGARITIRRSKTIRRWPARSSA